MKYAGENTSYKTFIYAIGIMIAIFIGVASAMEIYSPLAALIFLFLFNLPNNWLLIITFISSQLIYLIPSLLVINGIEIRISDPFIAVLVIKTLLMFSKRIRHPRKTLVLVALFFFVCFLSLINGYLIFGYALNMTQYAAFVRWSLPIAIFLTMPYVLTKNKDIITFSKVLIFSIVAQAVFSLVNFATSESTIRAANETGNVADYAVVLVLMTAITYSFITNSFGSNIINYLLLSFLVLSIFITFTRAAAIIFIIITLRFFLKGTNIHQKIIFSYFTVFLGAILLLTYWVTFKERFITDFAVSSSGEGSFAERLLLIKSSLSGFYENPIIGKGWSSFRLWNDGLSEVHSGYVQLLFDTGLLGLTVFIMLLFNFNGVLKKNAKLLKDPFIKSINSGIYLWFIGISIWLFVNQLLPGTLSLTYFWTVLGLAFAINKNFKDQLGNPNIQSCEEIKP